MSKLYDLAGQKFNQLTVIERATCTSDGKATWLCICDCGSSKIAAGTALRSGHVKSCGCLRSKSCSKRNYKHGHRQGTRSTTYEIWSSMWSRCSNTKHVHYKYYGGRGILVCEEWMRFEQFLADMGERPGDLTLDRREVNGNYEKDNCRWVTWDVQVKNRRKQTRKGQL